MDKDFLHIALVQVDLEWENTDQNLIKLDRLFKRIPTETDLIVLPEMFSTGFSMNVESYAEPMSGKTVSWMKDRASEMEAVISGSLMIKEDGNFFNRFVFVYPNGKIDFYDKRHLFSMGEENKYFSPGDERKVITIKGFRILPLVCYDLRFPVFSRNRSDYDLIVNAANWPAPRKNAWEVLLKARAIENQSYVAGVNRVGLDANGIRYNGGSAVIDPKGKIMVTGKPGTEDILIAKLSRPLLDRFRKNFPALLDRDEFDLNL